MRNFQPHITDQQVKWISRNLYECLLGNVKCPHRLHFGNKFFCSWLLSSNANGRDLKLPCPTPEEEHTDELRNSNKDYAAGNGQPRVHAN